MSLLQFAHEHPIIAGLAIVGFVITVCTIAGFISDTKIQVARAKEWNDRREKPEQGPRPFHEDRFP